MAVSSSITISRIAAIVTTERRRAGERIQSVFSSTTAFGIWLVAVAVAVAPTPSL